jgi:hypothetical protein
LIAVVIPSELAAPKNCESESAGGEPLFYHWRKCGGCFLDIVSPDTLVDL